MREQLVRWALRLPVAGLVIVGGMSAAENAMGGAADEISASGSTAAAQTAATSTATPSAAAVSADQLAAKKAAAMQKAQSMQKVSTALRSRRAQAQRAVVIYDDVNGQGASSLLYGASNWRSQFNQGTSASPAGSAYSGTNGSTGVAGSPYGNSSGTGSSGTGSSGTGSNSSSDPSTATTLGSKIVQYAQSQLGQTVGDGSSKALADAALAAAGAKPASQKVFGDVVPFNSIQPGDILQFQSAIFVGINYWMILGTPDHTAIVFMVQGSDVMLLHQDVNGIRLVQYSTVNLNDLHSGTITAYRAVASDSSSNDGQTGGTTSPSTTGGSSSGNSNCPKTSTSGSQSGSTTTTTSGQQSGVSKF